MQKIENGVLYKTYKTKNNDSRFVFYYTPDAEQSIMQKNTYKCFLKVTILQENILQIDEFFCKDGGGGAGKILMCTAINFLQEHLNLPLSTQVKVRAIASSGNYDRTSQGKNTNATINQLQDKLVAYYTRTYGFQITSPGSYHTGTRMSTTIGTIKAKCAAQGGGVRKTAKVLRRNRFRTTMKRKRALGRLGGG